MSPVRCSSCSSGLLLLGEIGLAGQQHPAAVEIAKQTFLSLADKGLFFLKPC